MGSLFGTPYLCHKLRWRRQATTIYLLFFSQMKGLVRNKRKTAASRPIYQFITCLPFFRWMSEELGLLIRSNKASIGGGLFTPLLQSGVCADAKLTYCLPGSKWSHWQ
uniref:Uncharacterized protein n=1 Tax=Picea sitchensis TaxID=3332 RepID=A0A6B9XYP2_PICSI|nr:hypothetical protein Q903MT_gene5783 [Picea sitchensis]